MTIEEAYGDKYEELKLFIDERGWLSWYQKDWGGLYNKMELQHGPGPFWRINSLRHLGDPVLFDILKDDRERDISE